MPPRIAQLPQDHSRRGMPVPYTVLRNPGSVIKNGITRPTIEYHFAVNDHLRSMDCADNKLCTICGKHLQDDHWAIGGPISAFMPEGVFADLPIHHECGKYALQVCPYLAVPSYTKLKDVQKMADKTGLAMNNISTGNTRVPFFVFVKLNHYSIRKPDLLVKPIRITPPVYHAVQYWHQGEQITPEEAVKLQMAAAPAIVTLLDPN